MSLLDEQLMLAGLETKPERAYWRTGHKGKLQNVKVCYRKLNRALLFYSSIFASFSTHPNQPTMAHPGPGQLRLAQVGFLYN